MAGQSLERLLLAVVILSWLRMMLHLLLLLRLTRLRLLHYLLLIAPVLQLLVLLVKAQLLLCCRLAAPASKQLVLMAQHSLLRHHHQRRSTHPAGLKVLQQLLPLGVCLALHLPLSPDWCCGSQMMPQVLVLVWTAQSCHWAGCWCLLLPACSRLQ
jgi:hypothetical protein